MTPVQMTTAMCIMTGRGDAVDDSGNDEGEDSNLTQNVQVYKYF